MSIAQIAQVWAHSEHADKALLVLLAIAEQDGDGGAWPSMQTIAERSRITESYARRIVRKLEESGEIITDRNGGGGIRTAVHMRTNRYMVNVPCPWHCDHTAAHRDLRKDKYADYRPRNWADLVTEHAPTPHHTEPPFGVEPPHHTEPSPGSAPWGEPPINQSTTKDHSSVTAVDGGARDSESPDDQDEYADLTPGEKQAAARKRMTSARDRGAGSGSRFTAPPAPHVPRYDPRTAPAEPKPRTAEDDAAVARLEATPCVTGKPAHLIPRTSTLCLWCSIDARTITQEATA